MSDRSANRRGRSAPARPDRRRTETSRTTARAGKLPLYKLPGDAQWPTSFPSGANLGLWHEKFFNGWSIDQNECSAGAPEKNAWLEGVVNGAREGSSSIAHYLTEWTDRTEKLVRASGGRLGLFTTVERMVSGTGKPHPVENGFAFHHLLGVPYLPGSSLKGVVRAWAEQNRCDDTEKLFGSVGQVGACQVLDALPVEPPRLVVEVLTPHYGGWTVDDPPGDWRSPVPIPFLAVEAGTTFLIGVMASEAQDQRSVDSAWELLVEALFFAGAGARTSIGFGRLELVKELSMRSSQAGDAAVLCTEESAGAAAEPGEEWRAALAAQGGQQVYEQARAMVFADPVDRDKLQAMVAALEALGYLPAWREGRKRGSETTGSKKLRELAARLDQLREQRMDDG